MADLRTAVARGIFNSGFHPDDVLNGNAGKKWEEWPDEQARAFVKADAAIAAYMDYDKAQMAERFGPNWRQHLDRALDQMSRRQ